MIDLELQLLEDNPNGLRVLIAYQKATEALIESEKAAMLAQEMAHAEALSQAADTAEEEPAAADSAHSFVEPDSMLEDEVSDEEAPLEEASSGPPKRRAATWLTRITSVEGVDSQDLSKIHGQFIAYGLLKCDLADRSAGMVYQLTSTAKKVLARLADRVQDEEAASEVLENEDFEQTAAA